MVLLQPLIFLLLLVATGYAGPWVSPVRDTVLALGVVALSYLALRDRMLRYDAAPYTAALALSVFLLGRCAPEFSSLVLCVHAWLLAVADAPNKRSWRGASTACVLCNAAHLLMTMPLCLGMMEALSGVLSKCVSLLFGAEINMGPSALGIQGTVIGFICALTADAPQVRGARRLPAMALFAIVGFVAMLVAIAIICQIARSRDPGEAAGEEGAVWFGHLHAMWVLAALGVGFVARSSRVKPKPSLKEEGLALGVIGTGLVALLVFAAQALDKRPYSEICVITSSTDKWTEKPSPNGGYNDDEGYWSFYSYMTRGGIPVNVRAALPAPLPSDALLIVCHPFAAERSCVAMQQHCANGGDALFIVEHTIAPDDLRTINAAISSSGMSVNFDSAFHQGVLARDVASYGVNGALQGALGQLPSTDYGVGASIKPGWRAEVVMGLRWGLGDLGVPNSKTLIGNRHYDNGDRLGDVVVVCRAPLQNGRLTIVGDSQVLLDSCAGFTERVRLALLQPWSSSELWLRQVAVAVCVILTVWGGLWSGIVSACVAGIVATQGTKLPTQRPAECVLWTGCGTATATIDRDSETSIRGAMSIFACEGLLPLCSSDLGVVRGDTQFLVIVAPLDVNNDACNRIENLVESGLHCWLLVGGEHAYGASSMLAAFGLTLENSPLGSHRHHRSLPGGTSPSHIAYESAWPLLIGNDRHDWRVHVAVAGRPIIASRRLGKGRITVFGDAWFLSDRNCRGAHGQSAENVQLLRDLIRNQ